MLPTVPAAVSPERGDAPPEWSAGLSFDDAQRIARVTRPAHQPIVDVLLAGAQLAPGMQVLDLACGQGVPALDEARQVGASGSVVGIDLSRPAVDLARRFSEAEGIANVTFREGDAEGLPFPDGSFDRVTSRFGAMFFPRLDRTAKEVTRVLRPGGRVAWMVWGPIEEQDYFDATALVALRRSGLAGLPAEAAQPFRLASGTEITSALEGAGLRGVLVGRHRVRQVWSTSPGRLARGFWESPPPPFVPLLRRISGPEQERAVVESEERFRRHLVDGAVRLSANVVLVTGDKPP